MTNSYMLCVYGGTSSVSSVQAEAMTPPVSRRPNLASALSIALPVRTPTSTFLTIGNQLPLQEGKPIPSRYIIYVLTYFVSSWLYRLILAIDANFRLKNKDRKATNDPALGDGWGHMVPEKPYQEYIKAYGYQEEVCPHVVFVYFIADMLRLHLAKYL
jgi:hypothetical protein